MLRTIPLCLGLILSAPPPTHAASPPWKSALRAAEEAVVQRRFEAALGHYQEAVRLAEGLYLDPPERSWLGASSPEASPVPLHGPLVASLRGLSGLQEARGQLEAAVRTEHRIDHLLDELDLPGGWERYRTQARMGALLAAAGDHDGAATMGGAALAFLEAREAAREPLEAGELFTLRLRVGEALLALGRRDEGLRRLRQAQAMTLDEIPPYVGYAEDRARLASHLGEDAGPAPGTAAAYLAQGRLQERLHDLDGAAGWYQKALEGASGIARAQALEALAALSRSCQGCALPDPIPLLREAQARRQQLQGDRHPDTLATLEELAVRLAGSDRGRLLEALRQVAAVERRLLGGGSPALAATLLRLADQARAAGEIPEALAAGREAVAILEGGPDAEAAERAFFQLSLTYQGLGRHQELVDLYGRKLAFLRRVHGPAHLKVGWRLLSLAEAEAALGRWAEAHVAAGDGLAILRRTGPEHAVETALGLLVRIEEALGLPAEARVHERERLGWARNREALE